MPQLDISLPARLPPGKPAVEIVVVYQRDLVVDDIALILTQEVGSQPRTLQRLRAVHHNIAILLSQGREVAEVSRITGRSPGNIHLLQKDPAFKALLTHYQQMGEQALADVWQQLSDTGQAALAALQEKLETDPDSVKDEHKIKIIELTMDRTGHGPSRTVKSVSSADVVKELVDRKRAERKGRIIDASAVVVEEEEA